MGKAFANAGSGFVIAICQIFGQISSSRKWTMDAISRSAIQRSDQMRFFTNTGIFFQAKKNLYQEEIADAGC
jgi:hypothetical protein